MVEIFGLIIIVQVYVSIGVSFALVVVDRRPRRCVATKTPKIGSQDKVFHQGRLENRPGGGIAIIMHDSLQYDIPTAANDELLESQSIKVKLGKGDKIINCYQMKVAAQEVTRSHPKHSRPSASQLLLEMQVPMVQPGNLL